jgi:hypothetical protein
MSDDAISASSPTAPHAKAWHVTLWIVQGLLAVLFGFAGFLKTTKPIPDLVQLLVWPGAVPAGLVRFIGLSELAGAAGLVLPALTRIKPVLTPLAATGLVVVMVQAIAFHVSRGELHALPINITLGALATLVAWGRFGKAPIRARS